MSTGKNVVCASRKIILISLGALIVLGFATLAVRVHAESGGSAQTITVTVPETDLKVEVENPDNFHTKSDSVKLKVRAKGKGRLSVTDQSGHELWSTDKPTEGEEEFTIPVKLDEDPGDYTLTVTMVGEDEQAGLTGEAIWHVVYEATPIVPPLVPPLVPDTNGDGIKAPNTAAYLHVFGRAVPTNQVISLGIYLVLLTLLISVVMAVKRRKPQTDANVGVAARQITSARRAQPARTVRRTTRH